jgi:imidazolonepropionase-like amidohydrolase
MRAVVCGVEEARQAARFNFKYGVDQVKMLATSAVLGSSDEAGPQELTYEEMRALIEVAEFNGKISAAHAIGNKGIKAAIKAGVTSIEHGSFMDEEAAEMMCEKGIYHVPTLIALERILEHIDDKSIPSYAIKKAKDCEQARIKAFQLSLKKGVKIAFGTDAATPYNKHGEQAYEFVLMVKYGMKPADAIISATKTAAELLRWDDRLGTLEIGKLADIISTRENPLEDISALGRVSFVMKDGEIYKREYCFNKNCSAQQYSKFDTKGCYYR